MLVISRKPGERIVIDGGIEITVVRCGHAKVHIGIEAPDEVNIVRKEILDSNDTE